MTQLDDMRDVIGAWLKFRGHSLNSTVTAELAQAKADAILAKREPQVVRVGAGQSPAHRG